MFIVIPLAVCLSYFIHLNPGGSRFLALRPAPGSLSGHEVRWPPAQAARKSQLENRTLHSSRAKSLCEMKTWLPEWANRGAPPWTVDLLTDHCRQTMEHDRSESRQKSVIFKWTLGPNSGIFSDWSAWPHQCPSSSEYEELLLETLTNDEVTYVVWSWSTVLVKTQKAKATSNNSHFSCSSLLGRQKPRDTSVPTLQTPLD